MDKNKTNSMLLAAVVGVLTASIFFSYRRKIFKLQNVPVTAPQIPASALYQSLKSLLSGADKNFFVQQLLRVSVHTARDCLTYMLQDTTLSLPIDQKVKTLFGVVAATSKKTDRLLLLSALKNYRASTVTPLLVIAAQDFQDIVPSLYSWIGSFDASTMPSAQHMVEEAYAYTVAKNDPQALGLLLDYHVTLDQKQATNLLWQVVQGGKRQEFVPLLASAGANMQKARSGKTLLTYALEHKNKKLVQALVYAGAYKDGFTDLSGLQVALNTTKQWLSKIF